MAFECVDPRRGVTAVPVWSLGRHVWRLCRFSRGYDLVRFLDSHHGVQQKLYHAGHVPSSAGSGGSHVPSFWNLAARLHLPAWSPKESGLFSLRCPWTPRVLPGHHYRGYGAR